MLDFFELDGCSDPSQAWRTYTRTWNWAAPLTTAAPAETPGVRPVAGPVAEGFVLSGQWHLPAGADPGRWLALPLADTRHRDARSRARNAPDLFVTASRVLPGAPRAGRTARGGAGDPAFRLDGVQVSSGFATHTSGAPLRDDDAAFAWTAVTGLAFGAARCLVDTLAALAPVAAGSAGPYPRTVPPADAAAGLTAVLRDERMSLAARVSGAPLAGRADATRAAEALAAQVRRASRTVHHVVAAAYERALPCTVDAGRKSVVRLVEESSPVLQHLCFAVELLPPGGRAA